MDAGVLTGKIMLRVIMFIVKLIPSLFKFIVKGVVYIVNLIKSKINRNKEAAEVMQPNN